MRNLPSKTAREKRQHKEKVKNGDQNSLERHSAHLAKEVLAMKMERRALTG